MPSSTAEFTWRRPREGDQGPASSSDHWRIPISTQARVKGKTENALLRLPFKAAYMFRPGAIQPLHGVRSKLLKHQPWLGNIRELQNVIERAVIATTEGVLRPHIADLQMQHGAASARTLADVERTHIMATLRETNWVVGGWNGAAAKLGLSRTTLIAKMQRLGLSKESPKREARPSETSRAASTDRYVPRLERVGSESRNRLN